MLSFFRMLPGDGRIVARVIIPRYTRERKHSRGPRGVSDSSRSVGARGVSGHLPQQRRVDGDLGCWGVAWRTCDNPVGDADEKSAAYQVAEPDPEHVACEGAHTGTFQPQE